MNNISNIIKKPIHTSTIKQSSTLFEKKLAEEINLLQNDIDKILEFENIKGKQNAFVIINKTKSQANVYRNNKLYDSFEIGIGEKFGDDLNTAKYINGEFSKEGRTTPAGQFFTYLPYDYNINNKVGYDNGEIINCLLLKGVQHPIDFKNHTSISLHQVSKSHPERLESYNTQGIRRGISTGCINFLPDEFYRLIDEINPEKTPIYILPEEQGNKLELVNLPNGLWFKPKFADNSKENIFLDAMKKFFNL